MRNKLMAGILLLGLICTLPGFSWAYGGHGGQGGRGASMGMGKQPGNPGMRPEHTNQGNPNGQSMGNNMSGQDDQMRPPCPPPGGGQYSQEQGRMMRPPGGSDRQPMGPPPQQMGYGGHSSGGGDAYAQGQQGRGPGMGQNGMRQGEPPMGPPPDGFHPVNGNWNTPNDWGQPGNVPGQN